MQKSAENTRDGRRPCLFFSFSRPNLQRLTYGFNYFQAPQLDVCEAAAIPREVTDNALLVTLGPGLYPHLIAITPKAIGKIAFKA